MVYRLLAVNIDGTLLRSDHRIDRQTKEALYYVQKKGVYVTLVTGRNFASAKKIARALKLNDAVLITHSGGFVASAVENPLFERRLDANLVNEAVRILEKYDCHIRIIHERQAIGNQVKQKNYLAAKMTLGIGDPLFYPVRFVDRLGEYLQANPISPPKIDAHFFNEEDRERAAEECRAFNPHIKMTRSTKCNFEIIPPDVSKVGGLRTLGAALQVPLSEMVAIGDSESDLEMIEQAGLGVAMGNAPLDVKQKADWVTRSNDQLGVSYMVREAFRKQLRMQIKPVPLSKDQ